MRQHPFSTPDGNKTYCKTCGYTREAGNHTSEYQFGECAYCGQRVGRKDGHWQALAGYRRLYCAQSPSTWHEVT